MKATILKIKTRDGKYFAIAEGPKVSLHEIEIEHLGLETGFDLWQAVGATNGRKMAISADQLSWLGDGQEHEYDYKLLNKGEKA